MSGLDLQVELERRGSKVPVVFITGQSDIALRRRALELGGAACLFKPFADRDLIAAISKARGTRRTEPAIPKKGKS